MFKSGQGIFVQT